MADPTAGDRGGGGGPGKYATYFWFLAFGGLLMRRRMDTATAGET